MNVNVIDAGDPGLYERWKKFSKTPGNVDIVVGGMCNGVVQVMGMITRQAPLGQVDCLTFFGHGASGAQMVAGGKSRAGLSELSALSMQLFRDKRAADSLSLITPYFSPSGEVLLMGCNVAAGQDGKDLLTKLSSIWQVPVSAADWFQSKGRSDYIGTVYTATKDGTVTVNMSKSIEGLQKFLSDDFAEAIGFIIYNLFTSESSRR